MNGIYLYRQILKGKWFIHYSYALTLGSILGDLLNGKITAGEAVQFPGASSEQGKPQMVKAVTPLDSMDWFRTYNETPAGSVAIIPLKDVMVKNSDMCMTGTEEIAALILKAGSSPNIDAIVLDIDTGGGSVDSVPPMLAAMRTVQEEYNKPIVGCGDMCASAGYYVGAHCDRLISANNLCSEFGSIGVIMSFMDIQPYYEKMGVKFHTITPPESDHKNILLEKTLKGEYDMVIDEVLSPLAIKFQNDVKAKRGNKLNMSIEGLLNGRMFFAANSKEGSVTALEAGLIDEVGNIERAVMIARSMAEARKIMTI